jgi:hypothetical protein
VSRKIEQKEADGKQKDGRKHEYIKQIKHVRSNDRFELNEHPRRLVPVIRTPRAAHNKDKAGCRFVLSFPAARFRMCFIRPISRL